MSNLTLFKDDSIDPAIFGKVNAKFIDNIKVYSIKYIENSSNYILLLDKIIDEVSFEMDSSKMQRIIAQTGSFLGESLKISDDGQWIFSPANKVWSIALKDRKKNQTEVSVFYLVNRRLKEENFSIGLWYRELERELYYGKNNVPLNREEAQTSDLNISYYDNFYFNQGFYPIANTTLDTILDRYQSENEIVFLYEWKKWEKNNPNLYNFLDNYLAKKEKREPKVVYFITIFTLIYQMLEYESEMYSYKLFEAPQISESTIKGVTARLKMQENIEVVLEKIRIENPGIFYFFNNLYKEIINKDEENKEFAWIINYALALIYEIFDEEFRWIKGEN